MKQGQCVSNVYYIGSSLGHVSFAFDLHWLFSVAPNKKDGVNGMSGSVLISTHACARLSCTFNTESREVHFLECISVNLFSFLCCIDNAADIRTTES